MAIVRFHERAIQIFAAKQNSEFAPAVLSAAKTTGGIWVGKAKLLTLKVLPATSPVTTITGYPTITSTSTVAQIKAALLASPTATDGYEFVDTGVDGKILLVKKVISGDFTVAFASISDSASVSDVGLYVLGNIYTKFKYGVTEGDKLGQATVGVYIKRAGQTALIGRVAEVISQRLIKLEEDFLEGTATGTSPRDYEFVFGPKNAIPVMNLSYSLETTSEAFMYSGDEKDRDETTVITDRYNKMDFETFVPALNESIGSDSYTTATLAILDKIPLDPLFAAVGMTPSLTTTTLKDTVTFSNAALADGFLTVEIRRSSATSTFTGYQKVYTSSDVRGTVDFDGVIGSKGKLKWSLQGNFVSIADKAAIVVDSTKLELQKKAIAGNISSDKIVSSQLELENIITTVSITDSLASGKKFTIAGLTFSSSTTTTPAQLAAAFSHATAGITGAELTKLAGLNQGKYITTFNDISIASTHNSDDPYTILIGGITIKLSHASGSTTAIAVDSSILTSFFETDKLAAIKAANGIYSFGVTSKKVLVSITGTLDYNVIDVDTTTSTVTFGTDDGSVLSTVPANLTNGTDYSTVTNIAPEGVGAFTGVLVGYNAKLLSSKSAFQLIPVYPNLGTELTVTDTSVTPISTATSTTFSGVVVDGKKSVCFDKLSSPNLTGLEFTRFLTGCGDGWSKGAIPTDVTITISEEQANASYNPDESLEKAHRLFLKWNSGNGSVLFTFNKLQLVKVTNSKVANFAGQDLAFRNVGSTSLTLSYTK